MSSPPASQISDILAAAAGSQTTLSQSFSLDVDLDAPVLPPTTAKAFTLNLFSRVLLETNPPKIRYICQQPHCHYKPAPVPLNNTATSNLMKHYDRVHPNISTTSRTSKRKHIANEALPSPSSFFEKRIRTQNTELTFRGALLDLIIQQNLPLSFADSESFHTLLAIVSPSTSIPSRRTLARDLEERFQAERVKVRAELQTHMDGGGLFSLTTDSWGAKNRLDFAAVTIHYIDVGWNAHTSKLLDMMHLDEPVHSGVYLGEKLLQVTDSFGITGSIFTITRDNAKPNDLMLDHFEAAAKEQTQTTALQPWTFTRHQGYVRCMAHILNLAVQDALKSIKATPSDNVQLYRTEEQDAQVLDEDEERESIASCLDRLRQHIYAFRLRRAWRDGLKRQADFEGEAFRKLQLDNSIRWTSTHTMLTAALRLRASITAWSASQELDPSMHGITLTKPDWDVLVSVEKLFRIFAAPATKLQADKYPTLNIAIPLYLKVIMQLTEMRSAVGRTSTLGEACKASLAKLNKYYNMATQGDSSHSAVATICDPRMNFYVFERLWPGGGMSTKRRDIRDQFDTCFSRYKHREDDLEVERDDQRIEDAQPQIVDSDDELFYASQPTIEKEWERWLKEPQAPKSTDLMQYWRAKQFDFPIIAQIARDHLGIPATSASSERAFSRGGNIITRNRNSLNPETVQHLMCVQSWKNVVLEDVFRKYLEQFSSLQ